MGKIIGNPVTSGFSGKFGDDLVFKQIGNRTFFARKGVTKDKPTLAQNGARTQFAQASYYASHTLYYPEETERYSIMARLNNLKSAQAAAVKDYMTKPEIKGLNYKKYRGKVHDAIFIEPQMLLKIDKIEVTIIRADGTVLESGSAEKDHLNWKYSAKAVNDQVEGSTIDVVAYDRFGKSSRVTTHI
ncbi:hypothetical protein [Chryseosolibacter indicus]|uniref:Uncharacterized protein n=1 Tax=Chryseosolibacter indicus TaxID=2782351 RepID=A0ABS5VWI3_9BACT|nr:hypothetical protein [Chryseosolibacter indicus]MBT1705187.1 hypothetical protein [Chryseosolibacter indicus]